MQIRPETPSDIPDIERTIERAFANHPRGSGAEVGIVRSLRASGALTVSLVGEVEGQVRGYVAASPVQIAGRRSEWHGLGPVAIDPAAQRMGLGSRLVSECLAALRRKGSAGCVVLGEPAFYGRFGFNATPGLVYPGRPPAFFMVLPFTASVPEGIVAYHDAFAS